MDLTPNSGIGNPDWCPGAPDTDPDLIFKLMNCLDPALVTASTAMNPNVSWTMQTRNRVEIQSCKFGLRLIVSVSDLTENYRNTMFIFSIH